MPPIKHPSSYRDPSGFLFYYDNVLYRQVNRCFKDDYDLFISSGFCQHLVDRKILIPHRTIAENLTGSKEWYQTLEPEKIPFISYPYEWCFDMLKDAALLTLEAAVEAMKYGMLLKDASAYNVQWHKGKMLFIDTLSFEKWDETKPWIAYRQFCEQFLAPLALMHYLKLPLQKLLLAYPDGIPVHIAKKLLPAKSKFNLNIFLHLHLHAQISEKAPARTLQPFSATKLHNLLRSLKESIQSFELNAKTGAWSGYYDEALQRENYVLQKKEIVATWLGELPVQTAIDVGANEGEFSDLLISKNIFTISADFDHYSINRYYNKLKERSVEIAQTFVIDLTQPSPALGIVNEERSSFLERIKTDLVVALALIHHLAIGKNVPFISIAKLFAILGKHLIIEFIPKEDEKLQLLLKHKKDVYDWYTHENFLTAFLQYYIIRNKREIDYSKRIIYLMESNEV